MPLPGLFLLVKTILTQVTELKNELELLMKGKFHEHFKNHEAKQQVVLDLMGDLEKKMDHRG